MGVGEDTIRVRMLELGSENGGVPMWICRSRYKYKQSPAYHSKSNLTPHTGAIL